MLSIVLATRATSKPERLALVSCGEAGPKGRQREAKEAQKKADGGKRRREEGRTSAKPEACAGKLSEGGREESEKGMAGGEKKGMTRGGRKRTELTPPAAVNPCDTNNAGCSDICTYDGPGLFHCECPTFSSLYSDGRTCVCDDRYIRDENGACTGNFFRKYPEFFGIFWRIIHANWLFEIFPSQISFLTPFLSW
jgi:hypothetical protein